MTSESGKDQNLPNSKTCQRKSKIHENIKSLILIVGSFLCDQLHKSESSIKTETTFDRTPASNYSN